MDPKKLKFGRMMREARTKKRPRIGLRALADRVELSRGHLSTIEREEVPPPSDDMIGRIAKALGEDPTEFLAKAGRVTPCIVSAFRRHPHEFEDLARAVARMPKRAQAKGLVQHGVRILEKGGGK